MDRWKAEMGRVREEKRREEERRKKKEDHKRESLRRKKIQVREKVGKSRNTVLFQWFVAPEGRKVGSLKRRVRSQLARWEMKNCTLLWREAHLQVKKLKTLHVRSTFGSWDVEKVRAVVARSTFRSKNVQNTPGPEHFWKLRCRQSARRCGAKHISKSKCTKHTRLDHFWRLHYTTTTTPLHYNYNYSCATPQYIQQLWVRWPTRWPLQPLQPLQKTQLQPPIGPSVDSLCHPWFTTTNLSYRFPIFETSATALCGTTGIIYLLYASIVFSDFAVVRRNPLRDEFHQEGPFCGEIQHNSTYMAQHGRVSKKAASRLLTRFFI